MAWKIPSSSRPGSGKSRGDVAPRHKTRASFSSYKSRAEMSLPTLTFVWKRMPSSSSSRMRRCTTCLDNFMVGIPYCKRPPMASFRSKTVTQWPALLSCWAQANPEGPEPTTATFIPVRMAGGWGLIQPFSNAWSMMAHSMFLMVTAGLFMPKTQADSHGAGHTRPVNSGKLLFGSIKSLVDNF